MDRLSDDVLLGEENDVLQQRSSLVAFQIDMSTGPAKIRVGEFGYCLEHLEHSILIQINSRGKSKWEEILFDGLREEMNPKLLKKLLEDREEKFDFKCLDYTYGRSLYDPSEVHEILYMGRARGLSPIKSL